jgi:hypothetical protein
MLVTQTSFHCWKIKTDVGGKHAYVYAFDDHIGLQQGEEKVCILESILHLKSAKQPMNPRGVDKEEAGSKCGERDSVAILHSSAHTKQNRYLPFSLCNLHYTMGCTH